MEVHVLSNTGLPDNCILSIRSGTVRRQAPITSGKSFKFSSPLANPLKFDILVPLGSGHLVARAGVQQYQVNFTEGGQMSCEVAVKESDGKLEATEEDGANKKTDAIAAKEYLERHRLLEFVQAVIHTIIAEKPKDPYAEMARHFMNGYGQSGTTEKPSTKIEEVSFSARTDTTAPQASSRTESTVRRPESAQTADEPEQFRNALRRSISESQTATKGAMRPDARLKQAEQRTSGAVVSLLDFVPLINDTSTADIADGLRGLTSNSRARLGQLLEAPTDRHEVRLEVQEKLVAALKTGDLQNYVKELEAPTDRRQAPTDKHEVRPAALKTGDLQNYVKELEAPTEEVRLEVQEKLVAALKQNHVKDVRLEIQEKLVAALKTGELQNYVKELEAPTDRRDSRLEVQEKLIAACKTGDLEKHLKEVGPPTDRRDMRLEVQEKLLAACETGDLQKHLKEVVQFPSSSTRSGSESDDLRVEIKNCILEACDNGNLLEALRSISGTVPEGVAPKDSVPLPSV